MEPGLTNSNLNSYTAQQQREAAHEQLTNLAEQTFSASLRLLADAALPSPLEMLGNSVTSALEAAMEEPTAAAEKQQSQQEAHAAAIDQSAAGSLAHRENPMPSATGSEWAHTSLPSAEEVNGRVNANFAANMGVDIQARPVNSGNLQQAAGSSSGTNESHTLAA